MYFRQEDCGPMPSVGNVRQMAADNSNFRTAIWTGSHLQMTLMCIPPCGEIGLEVHEDTDQLIRVEQGMAEVRMGSSQCRQEFWRELYVGDVAFIPAGTWHNVINAGCCPLRVSSVYAPPNHPWGTIHRTKADAKREEG